MIKSCIEDKISLDKESEYMENYKFFNSEGVVSLLGDESSSQKVKILRDIVLEIPLHEVNIKSSLINCNIVIAMRPSLPVEGISLVLGNDLLSGEKVKVDPRVVEKLETMKEQIS